MYDFRNNVYYPTVAFLDGWNPFNPEVLLSRYPVEFAVPFYLPITFLLHIPFALVSESTAEAAYCGLTMLLTFALAFASLRLNKLDTATPNILFVCGLILLSRPGNWNVILGQTTLEIVLASFIAYYFSKRSPIVSGIALALSVIKPTFGVPLALLMLAQGRFRPVFYGTAIATLANLPITLILMDREGGIGGFIAAAKNNFDAWGQRPYVDPVTNYTSVDLVSLLGRFSGEALGPLAQLSILISVLGIAGWILSRSIKLEDKSFHHLTAGIVFVAIMLSTYHQLYDLLLLTVPFVGLICKKFPQEFYASFHYRWSVLLIIFLAINYSATAKITVIFPTQSAAWMTLAAMNALALLTIFILWVHSAITIQASREQKKYSQGASAETVSS